MIDGYNMSMIKTYKNAIDNSDQIVSLWDNLSHRTKIDHHSRVCEGVVIQQVATGQYEEIMKIPSVIYNYSKLFAEENGIDEYEMEEVQIIKYEKGTGYFKEHKDGMDRKFSAILYLSDVAVGGETKVTLPDDSTYMIKPQSGKLVFFDSQLSHEAISPISDDKYVCVTWFR